jgi:hypothetical protein
LQGKISLTGTGRRQGICAGKGADRGADRGADGLRVEGEELCDFSVVDVPVVLCALLDLEPPFVDFCFFDFGAAFRLPRVCVHFITVAASVSNSAAICSRVLPAQTASRIFLHDVFDDEAAWSAPGLNAHQTSPATARLRYRIRMSVGRLFRWSLSASIGGQRTSTT